MRALVFGADGGLGRELCRLLLDQGHEVVKITRNEVDSGSSDLESKISAVITTANPDWIFNCVGILGTNQDNYRTVFDANFGTNWAIVRHYTQQIDACVQIVLVGSTTHNQPRRNSMLYAASKSALHNLWQSTEDIFANTSINIGLIHPPRINTAMLGNRSGASLEPAYVAQIMIDLTNQMKSRTLLELGT